MIAVGDKVPAGSLAESIEFTDACPARPEAVDVQASLAGKKVVIFGLPGAFTPTCSGHHVPGYLQQLDALKSKGVDEVWCVAANDGFVMAAWGKSLGGIGKIRFLGDGSALWAKAMGLDLDFTDKGMGIRMGRFSMLVDNGTVISLNVEGPGQFDVSDATTMLGQL